MQIIQAGPLWDQVVSILFQVEVNQAISSLLNKFFMCEEQDHCTCTCTLHVRIIFLYVSSLYNIASQPNIEFLFIYLQQNLTLDCIGLDIDICIVISHRKTLKSDMEKVKKCTQAEFLGFIISTKKCVIFNMSKAMEKCKNCSIFSKLDIY